MFCLVSNHLTNYGRRHFKLFTYCHVLWDTLYHSYLFYTYIYKLPSFSLHGIYITSSTFLFKSGCRVNACDTDSLYDVIMVLRCLYLRDTDQVLFIFLLFYLYFEILWSGNEHQDIFLIVLISLYQFNFIWSLLFYTPCAVLPTVLYSLCCAPYSPILSVFPTVL